MTNKTNKIDKVFILYEFMKEQERLFPDKEFEEVLGGNGDFAKELSNQR